MSRSPENTYKELLFTPEEVQAKIDEMAEKIVEKYRDKNVLFVQLLNGSAPFASKLMFSIARIDPEFHPNLQSMIISRYGAHREPSAIKIVTDLPPEYRDLSGYEVVLIDDLIDEGHTLESGRQLLLDYGAESVECVALVKKMKTTEQSIGGAAVHGFDAPDVWLTGMGMDDQRIKAEGNRWFEGIAIAND